MAAALGLHGRPLTRGVPVVVALADADGGRGPRAAPRGEGFARNVSPFGVLTAALTPQILLRGLNERLARACHDTYVREQLAEGAQAGPPSLVPWEDLGEPLRDSNRRFADAIGVKVTSVGATIVPAALAAASNGDLPGFTPEEVERLGRAEHGRWMEDLRRDGWRPTTGAKDPERKLHPLLVASGGAQRG